MSFSSSSSSTTPGYYDPETQKTVDWWKNKLMGEVGQGTPNKNYNPNWQQDYAKQNNNSGQYAQYGPSVINNPNFNNSHNNTSYEDYKKQYGTQYNPGERIGGLFDQYKTGSDVYAKPETVFTGKSAGYAPTDFGKTGYAADKYNSFNFTNPNLTTTSVNPDQFNNAADIINKGAARLGASNIQKAQDAAAYQGRGGGDLADYNAATANRDVAASSADELKKLASEKMGLEYANTADVKNRLADFEAARQQAQAGESRYGQTFADEAKKYIDAQNLERLKGTAAEKQFGAGQNLEYLKSKQGEVSNNLQGKLAEIMGNKQSLNDLLKILTGGTSDFAQKPTSSSSSKSMGFS